MANDKSAQANETSLKYNGKW